MGITRPRGDQLQQETVSGDEILDGSVKRVELNTTSPGEAVITKVIAGTNINISSTGADPGTGDVTINVTGSATDTKQVLISSNDTTEGYIEDKLTGVTNKIDITTLNDGGNEQLQLNIGSDIFDKTSDDASDVTFVPTTRINSTNVQDAIVEVEEETRRFAIAMAIVLG